MAGIWKGSLLHLFTVSISSMEDRRESVLAGFTEEPKPRGAAGTHLQERHHPCITTETSQVPAPSRYKHQAEGQLPGLPHPTALPSRHKVLARGSDTASQGVWAGLSSPPASWLLYSSVVQES